MIIVVFTFLFIDMFDTIGTVIGVSKKANAMNPDGTIPGVKKVLMADAIAKHIATVNDVRPVRPPSATPDALST